MYEYNKLCRYRIVIYRHIIKKVPYLGLHISCKGIQKHSFGIYWLNMSTYMCKWSTHYIMYIQCIYIYIYIHTWYKQNIIIDKFVYNSYLYYIDLSYPITHRKSRCFFYPPLNLPVQKQPPWGSASRCESGARTSGASLDQCLKGRVPGWGPEIGKIVAMGHGDFTWFAMMFSYCGLWTNMTKHG